MSSKSRFKTFQRALARYGMFTFIWLFERLPYGILLPLANAILTIGRQFIHRHMSIAQESVKIAFGTEKSLEERQRIIKQCFMHFGRSMIELFYFLSHPKEANQKIVYEGKEHLDQALKEGKGVIVVTAHFGNFPLMMLGFAQDGYKVHTLARPARDQALEAYLLKKRKEVGVGTIHAIPRRECVANTLKALRNNEIVFILVDQNFGERGGVYVDFFGQKAATGTGPVVFARRAKAPIIPMFMMRQKDDTHKVIIEEPIVLEEGEDDKTTMAKNMSSITSLIERYIRRYPQEWAWMHRRWKSQPSSKT